MGHPLSHAPRRPPCQLHVLKPLCFGGHPPRGSFSRQKESAGNPCARDSAPVRVGFDLGFVASFLSFNGRIHAMLPSGFKDVSVPGAPGVPVGANPPLPKRGARMHGEAPKTPKSGDPGAKEAKRAQLEIADSAQWSTVRLRKKRCPGQCCPCPRTAAAATIACQGRR